MSQKLRTRSLKRTPKWDFESDCDVTTRMLKVTEESNNYVFLETRMVDSQLFKIWI